jgi:hypothetical protein
MVSHMKKKRGNYGFAYWIYYNRLFVDVVCKWKGWRIWIGSSFDFREISGRRVRELGLGSFIEIVVLDVD